MNLSSVIRAAGLAFGLAASATMADTGIVPKVRGRGPQAELTVTQQLANEHDAHSVLVRFKSDVSRANRRLALGPIGGSVLSEYTLVPNLVHVRLGEGVTVERALRALNGSGLVRYAEPDYIVHATLTPNDPSYGSLWGMNNTGNQNADIDAPQGWDVSTGGANFVVADIDTGLDYTHPDLSANAWTNPGEIAGNGIDDDGNGLIDDIRGWDYVNNDNNPMDDHSHGTHTAGTIGARGNNGVGVVGVNWQCKIVGLKFLGSNGSGSISAALSCLQYAANKQIKVSNNSWGGGGYSQSFYDALVSSQSVGHIFCAAAGNNGSNNDSTAFYPSNYDVPNLIAVAAISSNGARAGFSNYGLNTVDLGAPGDGILSTVPGSSYSSYSGTSMATPHVAGAVAWTYALNPGWTWQQVRDRVLGAVRPSSSLYGLTNTGGLLNLASIALGPTTTISTPTNGAAILEGVATTFTASANDPQNGDVSSSIIWTSSINGQFGTGASISSSSLSVGDHTITARAVDSSGYSGAAYIKVTVVPNASIPPNPPSNPGIVKLGGTQVRYFWKDNAATELGFQVNRAQRVNSTWGLDQTLAFTGINVTQIIDNPGAGVWRYRVCAYNNAGRSNFTIYLATTLP
ncbi:MAG: S8 family serine peptidase [Phycisphaerae bacterium]|nr:S8 family serine peptidase [Phycisphaerae bacterium]